MRTLLLSPALDGCSKRRLRHRCNSSHHDSASFSAVLPPGDKVATVLISRVCVCVLKESLGTRPRMQRVQEPVHGNLSCRRTEVESRTKTRVCGPSSRVAQHRMPLQPCPVPSHTEGQAGDGKGWAKGRSPTPSPTPLSTGAVGGRERSLERDRRQPRARREAKLAPSVAASAPDTFLTRPMS